MAQKGWECGERGDRQPRACPGSGELAANEGGGGPLYATVQVAPLSSRAESDGFFFLACSAWAMSGSS